jgi:UDP-N-acetylmuramyl pentapeptide phosphotransferase/UDP-N-acetylglucosamine-1-phosphate transferase
MLGVSIGIYYFDRSAKIMLGDCGSNALGAVFGIELIIESPFWAICIAVILLAAFNLWCEKHSLNELIENTPWLRSLDRKIGVR